MAKFKCEICGEIFEADSIETAVCPKCGAKGEKLTEIKGYIDKYYLNDYNEKDLVNGAYAGYVSGLGDPYSAYMTKEDYESWMASATGNYSGVGITFSEDEDGNFQVLEVNAGSPAEKAGVVEGDLILTVDGQ